MEKYLSLFDEVKNEKKIGEGSTAYFYSKLAAKEIKEFNPSALIIIMIRNPVDLIHSLHSQLIFQGEEDINNFEEALIAAKRRKSGLDLPRRLSVVETIYYRDVAKCYTNINRYFDVFGGSKIKVIIFDDFKTETEKVLRNTLDFLHVDKEFTPNIGVVNKNKRIHNEAIHEFLYHPPEPVRKIVNAIFPTSVVQKAFSSIRKLNVKHAKRPSMDPELRNQLQAELTPEVEQLSELLDRDLTHWLKEETPA